MNGYPHISVDAPAAPRAEPKPLSSDDMRRSVGFAVLLAKPNCCRVCDAMIRVRETMVSNLDAEPQANA